MLIFSKNNLLKEFVFLKKKIKNILEYFNFRNVIFKN
jgi:hypothetical protein